MTSYPNAWVETGTASHELGSMLYVPCQPHKAGAVLRGFLGPTSIAETGFDPVTYGYLTVL